MHKILITISLAIGLVFVGAPIASAMTPPAPICHQRFAGGVPCHPDTGRCVSYWEQNQVRGDMRRKTVARLVGTWGHVISKRAFDDPLSGLSGMLGLSQNAIDQAEWRHRQIRSYRTCAEDGVPATFLVEYRVRHGVGRAVLILWQ